jgi:hypothetical protein
MGSSGVMRKLLWSELIPLFPILGMVLYFLVGPNSADALAWIGNDL